MTKSDTAGVPLSIRTAKAGSWLVAGKFVSKLIDFLTLVILARLLTPADFGLVAMAMVPIFVIEALMELPLAAALIRVPAPTKAMFDTAFTLALLRAAAVLGAAATISWPLSLFYGEPKLVPLICALALAPTLRGLVSPRMTLYAKRLDFSREFIIDVTSKAASLVVASSAAVATNSYWALPAGSVTTCAILLVLSYRFAPFKPTLTLSEWHRFSSITKWNTFSQFIETANWQLDRLLLPKFVDTATFGRYATASNIASIPDQAVTSPSYRPLLSAFSAIRSDEALRAAYGKATALTVVALAPVLLNLALQADLAIHLVLGDKWKSAAAYLYWIALLNILWVPFAPLRALAAARDRMHIVAVAVLVEFVVKIPMLLVAIPAWGVNGVFVSQFVAGLLVVAVSMWNVYQLVGMSPHTQFLYLLRPLAAIVPMAASISWISQYRPTDGWFFEFAWFVAVFVGSTAIYLLSVLLMAHVSKPKHGAEDVIWDCWRKGLRACRRWLEASGVRPGSTTATLTPVGLHTTIDTSDCDNRNVRRERDAEQTGAHWS